MRPGTFADIQWKKLSENCIAGAPCGSSTHHQFTKQFARFFACLPYFRAMTEIQTLSDSKRSTFALTTTPIPTSTLTSTSTLTPTATPTQVAPPKAQFVKWISSHFTKLHKSRTTGRTTGQLYNSGRETERARELDSWASNLTRQLLKWTRHSEGRLRRRWGTRDWCRVANVLNVLCTDITCKVWQVRVDCAANCFWLKCPQNRWTRCESHIAYTPRSPARQLDCLLCSHCNSVKFNFPIKCQKVRFFHIFPSFCCCAVKSFLRQTDIGEYYKTRHAATGELLLQSR